MRRGERVVVADSSQENAKDARVHAGEAPGVKPVIGKAMLVELLPGVMGLALARTATLSLFPTGVLQSDDLLANDGTSIIRCLFFAAVVLFLLAREERGMGHMLSRMANDRIGRALVVAQLFCAGLIVVLFLVGEPHAFLAAGAGAVSSIAGTTAIFYWLVQARNLEAKRAVAYVVTARMIGEVLWLGLFFATREVELVVSVASIMGQFACIQWAARIGGRAVDTRLCGGAASAGLRTQDGGESGFPAAAAEEAPLKNKPLQKMANDHLAASTEKPPLAHAGYFGINGQLNDRKFLLGCIAGCALLSLSIGILRSYPHGGGSDLDASGALVAAGLTLGLCALCALQLRKTSMLGIIAATWVTLMLLGCLAILGFSLAPENTAYGSVFSTTLNSVMGTFKWYLTIAFISLGRRNPYLYAIGTHLVFLLPRDIVQFLLVVLLPKALLSVSALDALAAISLITASQIILLCGIGLLRDRQAKGAVESPLLERVFELDSETPSSERTVALMQANAKEIGCRFGLTEREVEVLALFALGHTQKRVAEELFMSQSTAHAHIRHIYVKTNFHSRQEIIDYIKAEL